MRAFDEITNRFLLSLVDIFYWYGMSYFKIRLPDRSVRKVLSISPMQFKFPLQMQTKFLDIAGKWLKLDVWDTDGVITWWNNIINYEQTSSRSAWKLNDLSLYFKRLHHSQKCRIVFMSSYNVIAFFYGKFPNIGVRSKVLQTVQHFGFRRVH